MCKIYITYTIKLPICFYYIYEIIYSCQKEIHRHRPSPCPHQLEKIYEKKKKFRMGTVLVILIFLNGYRSCLRALAPQRYPLLLRQHNSSHTWRIAQKLQARFSCNFGTFFLIKLFLMATSGTKPIIDPNYINVINQH